MAQGLWAALAAAALVLAGCGRESERAQIEVEGAGEDESVRLEGVGEDGSDVSFRSGAAVAVPENLPAFVKLHPSLTLTTVFDGATPAGLGGMLEARSPASFEELAEFYRAHLQGLAFPIKSETNTGDVLLLTAADTEGNSLSAAIAEDGEGARKVTLQYGAKP